MALERLQKVLAAAGVASRRGSEALIAAGRVTIDGRVARLGDQVDPATSVIELDGRPIDASSAPVHLALHKPAGVTSTVRDRHAERTVLDLLPTALVPDGTRVYPVGRLDLDSEGLLLVTNDGAWADRVLHPRHGVEREYAVAVAIPLTPDQRATIDRGVALDEGLALLAHPLRAATPIEVRRLAALLAPSPDPRLTWYRATLRQGWKRQLRRMFGAVGSPIARLVRVRIGQVRIDGLPSGRARLLKAPEVRGLAGGGGRSRDTATPAREPGPREEGPRDARAGEEGSRDARAGEARPRDGRAREARPPVGRRRRSG